MTPVRVIGLFSSPGAGWEDANFGPCLYPEGVEVRQGARRLGTALTKLEGWRWRSFCKTRYAGNPGAGGVRNFLRCHPGVVAVREFAKKTGPLEAGGLGRLVGLRRRRKKQTRPLMQAARPMRDVPFDR